MGSRGNPRAQRSASAGGRAPEFELERTWEAAQPAVGAACTPPTTPATVRLTARARARRPRERARRRTSPGSSGRRSPGKHQSDARFQERAASRRGCWRDSGCGRSAGGVVLPRRWPAACAAAAAGPCHFCSQSQSRLSPLRTAHLRHLAMRLLSLAIFRSREYIVPELSSNHHIH